MLIQYALKKQKTLDNCVKFGLSKIGGRPCTHIHPLFLVHDQAQFPHLLKRQVFLAFLSSQCKGFLGRRMLHAVSGFSIMAFSETGKISHFISRHQVKAFPQKLYQAFCNPVFREGGWVVDNLWLGHLGDRKQSGSCRKVLTFTCLTSS